MAQSVSPGTPADNALSPMNLKQLEGTSLLKLGPFPSRSPPTPNNSDEGEEIFWDEKGQNKLVQIFISYGKEYINSIVFQHIEDDDKLVISPIYGSQNFAGPNFIAIMLTDEYITGICGSCESYHLHIGKAVSSLTIETNATTYGPFGNLSPSSYHGELFNVSFGPEDQFGGFHGTSSPDLVTSIGVYVKPIDALLTSLSKRTTQLRVE